jgi:hypothetical protein
MKILKYLKLATLWWIAFWTCLSLMSLEDYRWWWLRTYWRVKNE